MSLYRAKPEDGVVWITGASTGIGRELAIAMAKAGWTVAATARSADKLVELEEQSKSFNGRIHAFPADVTDAASVASPRGANSRGPTRLTAANSAANATSSSTARASRWSSA